MISPEEKKYRISTRGRLKINQYKRERNLRSSEFAEHYGHCWFPSDDEYLKAFYLEKSYSELGIILGRTIGAIQMHIIKLKLSLKQPNSSSIKRKEEEKKNETKTNS